MKTWQRFLLLVLTIGLMSSIITFYHTNYGEEKETEKTQYKKGY